MLIEHDRPLQRELDFPGTVSGSAREELTAPGLSEHRAELFGCHRDDRILG